MRQTEDLFGGGLQAQRTRMRHTERAMFKMNLVPGIGRTLLAGSGFDLDDLDALSGTHLQPAALAVQRKGYRRRHGAAQHGKKC